MPAAFLGVVQRLRIFRVRPSEGARQRILVLRYGHQVNMIGHQAITGDLGAVSAGVPRQQIQVKPAIIHGVEYLLAIIAALRDVMSHARNDDASTPRHELKYAGAACSLTENASVPF